MGDLLNHITVQKDFEVTYNKSTDYDTQSTS